MYALNGCSLSKHHSNYGITRGCGNQESSSLCFLCHMQKCCKLCSMVNTWSLNCSLISLSCSLYSNQVCQKVLYLFNAKICTDSIWWYSLPRAPDRKVCYIPGNFSPLVYLSPSFQPIHTLCMLFRSSKWEIGWQIRLKASVSPSMLEMLRQKYTVCKVS